MVTTLSYNNDPESSSLLKAAMAGDIRARIMYIQNEVIHSNGFLSGIAISWLTEMSDNGDPMARQLYIGVALRGVIPDCDWSKLESWILDIMKEDEREGCFLMGNLYNPALPGLSDWKTCEKYLRCGAEAGHTGCCIMLATAYREFLRDEVKPAEIRVLLERALKEDGDAEVYLMLAEVCLETGDAAAAVRTLKKCQNQFPQFPGGWTALGDMYLVGHGVRANTELALKQYYKAVKLGSSHALLKLGMMHYYGSGVRLNYNRAVNYFLRAAEAGETEAFHFLAVCYRYGDGVVEDRKEMLRWLEKGVEVDDPHCCMLMAGLCMLGDEVELDLERSSQLLEVAREKAPQDDSNFMESLDSLRRELLSVTAKKEEDDLDPEETIVAQLKELCVTGDKEGAGKLMLYIVENYSISPLIRRYLWISLKMKGTTSEWVALILDSLRFMASDFPDIALLLGDMYYFGVGTRRNAASALKFYKLAETGLSEQDEEDREDTCSVADVYARIILGIHEKVLKPKDFGINYWIGKAQVILHSSGRLNFLLGLLHYFGLHVQKDERKAKLLFSKAGKLGYKVDWKTSVEDCQFCRTSLYAEVYPELF